MAASRLSSLDKRTLGALLLARTRLAAKQSTRATKLCFLEQASTLCLAVKMHKLRRIRKYVNKIKPRFRRVNLESKKPRLRRNSTIEEAIGRDVDIYALTGLNEDVFNNIFEWVQPLVMKEKNTIRCVSFGLNMLLKTYFTYCSHTLDLKARLTLVLFWLRKYPSFQEMEITFNVSMATASWEITHLLPILLTALNGVIQLPNWNMLEPGFGGTLGIVDPGTDLWDILELNVITLDLLTRNSMDKRSETNGHIQSELSCNRCNSQMLAVFHNSLTNWPASQSLKFRLKKERIEQTKRVLIALKARAIVKVSCDSLDLSGMLFPQCT